MPRIPILLLSVVLLLGGVVWSAAMGARTAAAASATTTGDLELLASPAAEASVLLVVPAGATLSLDGPPQGEFYPVTYNGTAGWVPAAALVITKDTVAATGDAVQASIAEPSVPPTADPTLQPTVAPPPPPTAAPSSEPSGTLESSTPTEVPTEIATVEQPPSASPSAAMEPTPTATPFPILTGPATATGDVNLRAGPSSDDEVLFLVPAGSTVLRTGRYVNGWVAVDFMGIAGWVEAASLTEPREFAPEPTPTAEPEATSAPSGQGVGGPAEPTAESTVAPEPTATVEPTTEPTAESSEEASSDPGSGTAYATADVSLRSGPSSSYDEMATVPEGESVALTGVMENGFARVDYNGQIGWVATDYLSMPADPTPATSPRGTEARRVYSREEIVQIIYAAADRYDQPRADMLRVAECESNLDPYAVNPSGSYGLFQFIRSSWESTPYADRDIFDPRANANAAGWMWSVGRRNEWVCR